MAVGRRTESPSHHLSVPVLLYNYSGAPSLSWKVGQIHRVGVLTYSPPPLTGQLEPSPMGLNNHVSIST